MRPDRLVVYTTIYPGAEPYLTDWYASVHAQTDQRFDLCIGLDLLTSSDVARAIGTVPDAQWVGPIQGATPARIRSDAMALLVEQYPAVVFVDSDDVLLPSRVAAARRMLERADVAGCALDMMDAEGRALGIRFKPPVGADSAALLPRCNVFGLSNTAYRSATLRRCLPVPDECVLVDWLLATRAWSNGASFAFDATPHMRYRQYPSNVAPMLQPFDDQQVMTATARVLDHYRCLLDMSWDLPRGQRAALEGERRRVVGFEAAMRQDARRLTEYVTHLNRLPPVHVWWWQVANPELEQVWTS